jgi:iron(III) transport system substrate-binding protein
MIRRRAVRLPAIISVAALAVATACGAPPTSSGGGGAGFDTAKGDTAQRLDSVYDQVGTDPDVAARREKLIELARAEGGTLTWYTAFNQTDAEDVVARFGERTGIEVRLYRAGSSTVRQRAEQEAQSGEIRADVMSLTGSDPAVAAEQGFYAELKTPVTDRLIPEAVFPTWVGDQIYPFVPAWNTDVVPPDRVPKNYVELLSNFRDGGMVLEVTDQDWFFGMVQLLKERNGMTEDAAIELIRQAAAAATPFDGHTLMTELIGAGEYQISPDNYHYRVESLIDDGAPLAWSPAIGPIIGGFGGSGIVATAQHPAAALLFMEYVMTDVQDEHWKGNGRTPTTKDTKLGILSDPAVELYLLDYAALMPDIEHWQDLYQQLVQASGKKPRDK